MIKEVIAPVSNHPYVLPTVPFSATTHGGITFIKTKLRLTVALFTGRSILAGGYDQQSLDYHWLQMGSPIAHSTENDDFPAWNIPSLCNLSLLDTAFSGERWISNGNIGHWILQIASTNSNSSLQRLRT